MADSYFDGGIETSLQTLTNPPFIASESAYSTGGDNALSLIDSTKRVSCSR